MAKSGSFRRHKTESSISRNPTFSGLLSEASQQSQQTRTSLKKNTKSGKSTAKSFFDTLGDDGDTTTTTLTSPTAAKDEMSKKNVDPLSKYDPEISTMSADDENSDELVFGANIQKPADPVKRPLDSGKRQALSVLSVISSQKPEMRLSFSGLFPKKDAPVNNFGDVGDVDSQVVEKSLKRRLEEIDLNVSEERLPPIKRSKVEECHQHDENMSDDDRTADDVTSEAKLDDPTKNEPVDPAQKELPKGDIYSLGYEDVEDEVRPFSSAKSGKRSFVAAKKSLQKNPSENYVKINLKKKNYVRGKKTMTGPKYRRQEWKRKQAEKDKKSSKAKKVSSQCLYLPSFSVTFITLFSHPRMC